MSSEKKDVYEQLYERHEAEKELLSTLKEGSDKVRLENSLQNCNEAGVKESSQTYQRGWKTASLNYWLESELRNAVKNVENGKSRQGKQGSDEEDADVEKEENKRRLEEAILRVKVSGVQKYLEQQLKEAEEVLEKNFPSTPRFRPKIIGMSNNAISEMRKYSHPSPVVHRVMAAMFLLLGEDEQKTLSWSYVQKLCDPRTLNSRLFEFDEEKIDKDIKKRVVYLLDCIEEKLLEESFPGAACFYHWTRIRVGGESHPKPDSEKEFKDWEKEQRRKLKYLNEADSQIVLVEIEKKRKDLQTQLELEARKERKKFQDAVEYQMEFFYGIKKPKPRRDQAKNVKHQPAQNGKLQNTEKQGSKGNKVPKNRSNVEESKNDEKKIQNKASLNAQNKSHEEA